MSFQRRAAPGLRGWQRSLLLGAVVAVLAGGAWGLWQRSGATAEAACPAYTVQRGDTLGGIAWRYHTTVAALAKLNAIRNVNLIYVGQRLCIANGAAPGDPLEWSAPAQVRADLLQAADQRGLPRNLVLAIGWEESRWTQHVIAWDGGIGAMQLMPYTAAWLNRYLGTHYNPYRLRDNIALGTWYLRILWNDFGGDQTRIISAYNEGEQNVRTRGIFNWFYVNAVRYYMRRFI